MNAALKNNRPNATVRRQVSGVVLYHKLNEDVRVLRDASIKDRALAIGIDWIMIGLLQKICSLPMLYVTQGAGTGDDPIFPFILYGFTHMLYHLTMLINGQTPGKAALGIRVVPVDGRSRVTIKHILVREFLGRFITYATLGLGYFIAFARQDRRALHDLTSDTRVVRNRDL